MLGVACQSLSSNFGVDLEISRCIDPCRRVQDLVDPQAPGDLVVTNELHLVACLLRHLLELLEVENRRVLRREHGR
jgi:hypothetical protein